MSDQFTAVRQMIQLVRKKVDIADIRRFCTNDPGYLGYVEAFASILLSGKTPTKSTFEIAEMIGHVASSDDESERFRRFRIFVNSVASDIALGREGPSSMHVVSDIAVLLLSDAYLLQDTELLHLLFSVFDELGQRTRDGVLDLEFLPFLSLGQLILVLLGYGSGAEIGQLIRRVRAEETEYWRKDAEVRGSHAQYTLEWLELRLDVSSHGRVEDPPFLWSCTRYRDQHHLWKKLIGISFPDIPPDDPVSLLRRDLLGSAAPANALREER